MTLHDRIMGQLPDDITNGGEEFYDGFAEASRKAATLAKEADELMAEMADLIDGYKMVMKAISVRPTRSTEILEKYNTYKERTK